MVKVQYEHVFYVNRNGGTINNTSYVVNPYQSIFKYDSSNYVNPSFYLEVIAVSATAGTNDTYFQLYDLGTNDVITASGSGVGGEVITSSTTAARYTSSAISLTSGNRYAYQNKQELTATMGTLVQQVKLIIIDEVGSVAPTAMEYAYQLVSEAVSNTTTSYVESDMTGRFYYDSSERDGTCNYYLEVTVSQAGGYTGYVELYNVTDSTQVCELSVSSTDGTRVRSSALSLTNGKTYSIRNKSGYTGYGCSVRGAKLVIVQSGAITKSVVYNALYNYITKTTASYYTTTNCASWYYDSTNRWTKTPIKITALSCMRGSSGSVTYYHAITTFRTSTVLTNSELSTTSTTKVLRRSLPLAPSDGTNYMVNSKTSSTSGTGYWAGINVEFFLEWPKYTRRVTVGSTEWNTSNSSKNSAYALGGLAAKRVGFRRTYTNTVLKTVSFYLANTTSASGQIYIKVRKYSDDSELYSAPFKLAEVLTSTSTEYTHVFSNAPVINDDVFICLEFNTASVSIDSYSTDVISNEDLWVHDGTEWYLPIPIEDHSGTAYYGYELTSDARLKKVGTITKTSDARLKKTFNNGITSDATLASSLTTQSFTKNSDARLLKNYTLTKNSNARLLKTYSTTKTSDARLKKTYTSTKNSDARLKEFGLTFTKYSDARLKELGLSFTKTSAARLLKAYSTTKTADARLKKEYSTTKTSNAKLIRNISVTKTSDARLKKVQTFTKYSDAKLIFVRTTTKLSDARLKKTYTSTKTSDARLRETYGTTKTSDARLKKTFTSTKFSDARLKELGLTLTKNSDARLKKTYSTTKTSDARLRETYTTTKNSDARLVKTYSTTKNSNAKLIRNPSITKTSDARLRKTYDITKTSNAKVFKNPSITKTSDARLKKFGITLTKFSNARLLETYGLTKTSAARLVKTFTTTKTSDARLLKAYTTTKTSDARLKEFGLSFTKTADARLRETFTTTKTSDARLLKAYSTTKTSDARLVSLKSITKSSDALLVTDPNLKARYDMSTLNGSNLKDLSGYGNDGVPNGGITIGGVAGVSGNATDFDGTDDYINLGTGSTISNISSNALTLVAWVYPDEVSGLVSIIDSTDSGTSPYALRINTNGQIEVALKLSGTQYVKTFGSVGAISAGEWTMVAFTFNGTTWTCYINGVALTPQTQAGTLDSTANGIVLGRYDP